MTISMTCDSCGAQLRFGDQHAGKRIRCPKCQEIQTAPDTPDAVAPAPATTRKSPPSKPRSTQQPSTYDDAFEDYSSPSPQPARRASRRPLDERRQSGSTQKSSSGLYIGLGIAGLIVACGGLVGALMFFMDFGGTEAGPEQLLAATNTNPTSQPALPVPAPQTTQPNQVAATSQQNSANGIPGAATSGPGSPAGSVGGSNQPNMATPGFVTPGVGVPGVGTPVNPEPVSPSIASNSGTPTTPSPGIPTVPSPGIPPAGTPAETNSNNAANPDVTTPTAGILAASDSELPLSELFARVKPAIVRVNVATTNGSGQGSGFVVDPSGIIVTNYHVVAGGNRAWVEFFDNERVEIEGVLYLNYKKDLALLKIDPGKAKRPLVGIPLAKDLPAQGVTVAAIGAPLGLDMSISEGIVSAVRTANELKSSIGLTGHEGTWVQTTAAISPGNSGGPLLNRRGEVIAINTMTYAAPGAQALNFGISCADIGIGVTEKDANAVALTPLIAPERDMGNNIDPSTEGDFIDVSGTDEGRRLLAEVKKVQITFLASSASDPNGVVIGAVRNELNNTLKRLKIEESILSNDVNILLIAVRLDAAGDKRSVFITAHIISEDKSTGVPRALKLWEKTGNAGTVPVQALLTGRLSNNFNNDLRVFFGKLREDVTNARKALKPDSEQ